MALPQTLVQIITAAGCLGKAVDFIEKAREAWTAAQQVKHIKSVAALIDCQKAGYMDTTNHKGRAALLGIAGTFLATCAVTGAVTVASSLFNDNFAPQPTCPSVSAQAPLPPVATVAPAASVAKDKALTK